MIFNLQANSWPANIKFVSTWPVVGSRLGDIGYLDSSGIWRKALNVVDAAECRAHAIFPLLSANFHTVVSEDTFEVSNGRPIVRTSTGWEFNFLDPVELQHAEWGVPPPLDPQLVSSKPQQGLEIRRIPKRPYLPLRGLIAGPTIIVRKLDLGDHCLKLWISKNWNRIAAIVNLHQQSFPPHPEYRETCLALTEYISESWTTIYDQGNPDSINLFPIVLGYAEGNGARPSWSGLQLPRPTMSGRLGTGEWNQEYVIGCNGVVIPKYPFKIWAWRVAGIILCRESSAGWEKEQINRQQII